MNEHTRYQMYARIKQSMSFNEELRQTIRELKYRMQELDAKTVNDKIDVPDVTARIKEIYRLTEKLEKNWK